MEGKLLGGRYQLVERIGGGGMAIVFKAKDLFLNRTVAMKVLRPQYSIDEDFVQRFRREAQAVASLSHPNVVSVYDVGQEDDTHFMVMEYIEGSTLKDVINEKGALPVAEAVRIAVQICDALDHAHQNHIIHRDIKPQNILIGKNGRVKVTDFGIARAVTAATITQTGAVLGSVHYFSPEQARGGVTAEKSDIYSLGIVFYEMLTGTLPFSGESPISVALKHLQDPLPEPRRIKPEIPQSVENVVLKALVKDPFLRYRSAKEMLQDLETCLLPERLNEPKVRFDTYNDEETTRVWPAVTDEMMDQYKAYRSRGQGNSEKTKREPEKEGAQEGQKPWWKKALLWSGLAALFVVLGIIGFNYAMNIFYVPDVEVPTLKNLQAGVAEVKLREANLVPKIVEKYHEEVEEGIVFDQSPAPGMKVKQNATVEIMVSKGPEKVEMPNVVHTAKDTAAQQLTLLGFKVTVEEREDEEAPPGQVIDQSPLPGAVVVPKQTEVVLVVSKGKKYVKMPNLVGKSLDEAKFLLVQANLTIGQLTKEPSYVYNEPNYVISTYPYDPGMDVPEGTAIPLTVSNGEYPQDAKMGTYNIYVEYNEVDPVNVRILVTDARGKRQLAYQETITESKEYAVQLVLSPQVDGLIEVFVNGKPYMRDQISYDNFPR